MAEYDNTNTGAAFKPFDTQRLILQGKIDFEGNERKVVCVADETKNGTRLIEVYEKVGVLFENDQKGNDKAPNYSGPVEPFVSSKQLQMAAWKKTSDNAGNFLSIRVSEKQSGGGQSNDQQNDDLSQDEIPW